MSCEVNFVLQLTQQGTVEKVCGSQAAVPALLPRIGWLGWLLSMGISRITSDFLFLPAFSCSQFPVCFSDSSLLLRHPEVIVCKNDAGDVMRLLLRPSLADLPLRALSFPAARALLVCASIWLLAFTYGKLFLWRDPHSAYFSSDSVYDLAYSAVRQQQAREFIAQVSREAVADADGAADGTSNIARASGGSAVSARKARQKTGDTPAVCAAFVTVRRDSEAARFYMADALGSMLAGLDVRERAALNVSMLFGNMDPARHPDWGAPWVGALADSAAGYSGLTDTQRARLRKAEEERDLQLKGVFDYLYVLERCLTETSAPFIAVFEDDVIFAADWMARTMRGLQYLVRDYKPPEGEKATDWLYLRLFYTETHLGWLTEGGWWYNHLPLTFAIAMGTTAALLVILRFVFRCGARLRLDWATIAVLSLVVAPAFTVLIFMAGKHNLPIPGYSLHHGLPASLSAAAGGVMPMDQSGCCTQALVFNRPALPPLIQYLRDRERGQTDSMIEEYSNARGIRRFALSEQAVQHVGLFSSRGMQAKDAQSVWAFWFEASKPDEVERRHRVTVEEVDWALFDNMSAVLAGRAPNW